MRHSYRLGFGFGPQCFVIQEATPVTHHTFFFPLLHRHMLLFLLRVCLKVCDVTNNTRAGIQSIYVGFMDVKVHNYFCYIVRLLHIQSADCIIFSLTNVSMPGTLCFRFPLYLTTSICSVRAVKHLCLQYQLMAALKQEVKKKSAGRN